LILNRLTRDEASYSNILAFLIRNYTTGSSSLFNRINFGL